MDKPGFLPTANQYEMKYVCTNCGHNHTFNIPRGQPADKKDCPHCGCYNTAEPIRMQL